MQGPSENDLMVTLLVKEAGYLYVGVIIKKIRYIEDGSSWKKPGNRAGSFINDDRMYTNVKL